MEPPQGQARDAEFSGFSGDQDSVDKQDEHGPQDRSQKPRSLVGLVKAPGASEPTGDKRARDAQEDRDDKATWIPSRHQKFCDQSDDKANENRCNHGA